MHNQSLFVKVVIWFMVFLMSIGFVGLVIAPFVSNSPIFGGGGGREATEELVAEARADVRRDNCGDTDNPPRGDRLQRCKDALSRLASSYTTLATPEEGATEAPRDSQRNLRRAEDAYRALYEIDPSDDENAARYAGFLRDSGKTQQALEIFTKLSKENPQNEDYLLQKAGAHQQLGETDEAISTLRQFVRRFPDSGQVEQIREEIRSLEQQRDEQAAGGGAAGEPITVG